MDKLQEMARRIESFLRIALPCDDSEIANNNRTSWRMFILYGKELQNDISTRTKN